MHVFVVNALVFIGNFEHVEVPLWIFKLGANFVEVGIFRVIVVVGQVYW